MLNSEQGRDKWPRFQPPAFTKTLRAYPKNPPAVRGVFTAHIQREMRRVKTPWRGGCTDFSDRL